MGRPRTDSRRITVDGVVYRYHVRPDDGYIVLLVRREAERGQWLFVTFGYHDEWLPAGDESHRSAGHRLILPRVVRAAIVEGLQRGWNPSLSRPQHFRMFDGDDLLPAADWPRTSDAAPDPDGTR